VSEAPATSERSAGADQGETPIIDVWSRTQSKYRIRAVALLITNIVLFCGLCIFVHWLHFARAFDFSLDGYLAPMRFWDSAAPNLTDFILAPINVVEVPLHAIVLGLVVSVMVAVPIVVSILYRLPSALPFIAAVLIFAHMPWMSVTLLGSCILASVRPFRLPFRFGSALVGLLPVVLYLYMATRGRPDLLANYGAPTQKSLLIAPWLIAILGAAIMLGVVVTISRFVNYRPGAVAPVLAIMFAIPVSLFHLGVGADELAYRVLETEYGPRSKRFQPTLQSRDTENAIYALIAGEISKSFTRQIRSNVQALWSLQPEKLRELKRTVSRRFLADFLADRSEAHQACRRFIADYPHSRYVPNVLYIQARVLDTRLDEAKLAHEAPVRELYSDFPHVQSAETWLALRRGYPDSPFAVLAGLRLAELALRSGEIDDAMLHLEFALSRNGFGERRPTTTQPGLRGFLTATAPESRLDFHPEPYHREARRLLELIRENRDEPSAAPEAIVELAALDPRRAGYRDELLRLAERARDSRLYDNLAVRWAMISPDINERAETLRACLRTFDAGDARPEALFHLAGMEIQALGAADEAVRAQGVEHLRELVDRYPQTCWAALAAVRLEITPSPADNVGVAE